MNDLFRYKEQSLYDAIKHDDIDSNDVAFEYFNIKFTYTKLYDEIERAAKAFRQAGVGKGDIVSLMLPTLPETLYSIYALNRIGAIANFIDIRSTPQQVKKCLERTHSKVLFVMSFYLKSIETVRNELNVNKIILLRGCDSTSSFVLFWYRFSEFFNGRKKITRHSEKYCFWNEFIQQGATFEGTLDDPRHSDEPAMVFQTSGTTGNPKSVVHSSFSINNSADWAFRVLHDAKKGGRVLSILPAFAFYGFVTNVHLGLMNGMTDIIIPLFDYHQFGKLLAKHKPNYTFGIPAHWEHIVKSGAEFKDLSFLKDVSVAGEIVEPGMKDALNALLKEKGSKAELTIAYGMTETGGCVSLLNTDWAGQTVQKRGNVGKPMPFVKVGIFEADSEEEVKHGNLGEVCIQTAYAMKEYYGDPESTSGLLRTHADGQKWMHTGDLGYLSEDGILYVVGRIKRMIVRFDGTKLFPIEIEEALKKCPGVKECVVISTNDPNHIQAQTPYAFVVPESEAIQVADLWQYVRANLPVHMLPSEIQLIGSIPLIGIGKPDYTALSTMANAERTA